MAEFMFPNVAYRATVYRTGLNTKSFVIVFIATSFGFSDKMKQLFRNFLYILITSIFEIRKQ